MKKHWWGFIGISSFLFRFLFARCAWFMFCFLGCLLASIQLLYLLSLTQWAWSSWLEVIYLFIYIFLFLVSTRNGSIRWVIRRALRLFRNWFSTAWILLVLKVKKKLKIIIWKRHIQLSQWDIRTIQSLHWIVFQVPHLVMNIFLSYKGRGRQVLQHVYCVS